MNKQECPQLDSNNSTRNYPNNGQMGPSGNYKTSILHHKGNNH